MIRADLREARLQMERELGRADQRRRRRRRLLERQRRIHREELGDRLGGASTALWKLERVPSPISPISRPLKRGRMLRNSSRCAASARMARFSSRPMIAVYPTISLNMIAASSRVARAGTGDSAYQQPFFPFTALEDDDPRHRPRALPVYVKDSSDLLVPKFQAIKAPT
jgi:hypothetical protein